MSVGFGLKPLWRFRLDRPGADEEYCFFLTYDVSYAPTDRSLPTRLLLFLIHAESKSSVIVGGEEEQADIEEPSEKMQQPNEK